MDFFIPIIDKMHLGWAHTFLKHGWFAHAHVQAQAHAQAHSQAHAHAQVDFIYYRAIVALT